MSTLQDYEIYSSSLYNQARGYPLFEPDPAGEYDYVRPGDVGYTEYGGFHRLFNINYPADHSINRYGVPEYYEPLRTEETASYSRASLPPGTYVSKNMRKAGDEDLVVDQSRRVKLINVFVTPFTLLHRFQSGPICGLWKFCNFYFFVEVTIVCTGNFFPCVPIRSNV